MALGIHGGFSLKRVRRNGRFGTQPLDRPALFRIEKKGANMKPSVKGLISSRLALFSKFQGALPHFSLGLVLVAFFYQVAPKVVVWIGDLVI